MARIRSIKPDFWTSPSVIALSPMARLLFIGSWNFADDWGVLSGEPDRLRLQVLPGDDVDAGALVDEIVDRGLMRRRTAPDGTAVLVLPSWKEHQKIDKRSAGRWGDPDEWSDATTFPPTSAESPPIPPNPAESHRIPPLECKGEEGKGEESGATEVRRESGERPGRALSPPAVIESGTHVAQLVAAKLAEHCPTSPTPTQTPAERQAGQKLLDALALAPDPPAALRELPDVLDWALTHSYWSSRIGCTRDLPSAWAKLHREYASRKPRASEPTGARARVLAALKDAS